MAEGIGLLNQRTILLYHGFESLFLRLSSLGFLLKVLSNKVLEKGQALEKGQPKRVS